jgi:hypothetical protein
MTTPTPTLRSDCDDIVAIQKLLDGAPELTRPDDTEPLATGISERALVQRINRRLTPANRKLRKVRCQSCPHDDCGPFYLLDATDPQVVAVVENNMTLLRVEAFARELGVLADDEEQQT